MGGANIVPIRLKREENVFARKIFSGDGTLTIKGYYSKWAKACKRTKKTAI